MSDDTPVAGKPAEPHWVHVHTVDEMNEFYLSKLPAIAAAARAGGYAIGLHGSALRDLDLIAVPWADSHESRDELARMIQLAACGFEQSSYQWEEKPNGRHAVSFPICWTDPAAFEGMLSAGHIDLSVMGDERLTRERKRGERMSDSDFERLMKSRGFLFDLKELGYMRVGYDAGIEHAGDSDELAALRAELAETVAELKQHKDAAAFDWPHQERLNKLVGAHDPRALGKSRAESACDCIEALAAERDAEKARADRAERDLKHARNVCEARLRCMDRLTLDRTQATARIAELEAALEDATTVIRRADVERMAQGRELAEAREELRKAIAILDDAPLKSRAQREWVDAHRAKPSPQSPRMLALNDALPREQAMAAEQDKVDVSPPYETAPTLEEGVRYRVVDRTANGAYGIGDEYVAEGPETRRTESVAGPGWFDLQCRGWHRVVRVESAPADDGPPRVGDTVRLGNGTEQLVQERDDEYLGHLRTKVTGGYGWLRDDQMTVIRRAAQSPPATPEPADNDLSYTSPPGRPVPRKGFATAAELSERDRKIDRLEMIAAAHSPVTMRVLCEEIRAEREARKL